MVFTGDLTSRGQQGEFSVGSTFLRNAHNVGAGTDVGLRLGPPLDQINTISGPKLFAIPGNHDVWQQDQPVQHAAYRAHFPGDFPIQCSIVTRSRPIVLYGLDSTQTTYLGGWLAWGGVKSSKLGKWLARGGVKGSELDRLSGLFEASWTSNNDVIQIVCLHHPLADPPDRSYKLSMMRLDDRDNIASRLRAFGVDLVLAGHVHRCFIPNNRNLPPHAVVGSATKQFSRDRNFLLIDIHEKKICLTVFDYCKDRLQFVPRNGGPHSIPLKKRKHKGTVVRART